jgi:hypothetical protein
VEYSATGVSLTALTERILSERAIPPGRRYFLLMVLNLIFGTFTNPDQIRMCALCQIVSGCIGIVAVDKMISAL